MPFLLHERATLDINVKSHTVVPMGTNLDVWTRLVDLASMARALDPSLPFQLRFAKTAIDIDPLQVPFVAMFTNSNSVDLRADAVNTDPANNVLLMDGLARSLPPQVFQKEMYAIGLSQQQRFANVIDAAVYTGFREAVVDLKTVVKSDPLTAQTARHVTSGLFRIPELSFLNNPNLAQQSWLAPVSNVARIEQNLAPMVGPFASLRNNVHQVRHMLSAPFAQSSLDDQAEVVRLITRLNGRHDPRPFEERYDHGWIAFALSEKAGDWASFLIDHVGANPRQTFNGATPLALAAGTNDVVALEALLKAGISPHTSLKGIPQIFDKASAKWLKGFDDISVPVLVWASAMGASDAVNHLLHNGADPDATTERGRFSLLLAAQSGDEATARYLVAHGANMDLEDQHGRLPEETIPELPENDRRAPSMNALYENLSTWRTSKVRPAVEPSIFVQSVDTSVAAQTDVSPGIASETALMDVAMSMPTLPSKAKIGRKLSAKATKSETPTSNVEALDTLGNVAAVKPKAKRKTAVA